MVLSHADGGESNVEQIWMPIDTTPTPARIICIYERAAILVDAGYVVLVPQSLVSGEADSKLGLHCIF